MRYYLRNPEKNSITGPFELDEIEAKLKVGELSAGTLATEDIGDGLAKIQNAPTEDWVPVESIPGLGEERLVGSKVSPPPPPPLPPQNGVTAPLSTSSGMAFCPACGHKLAPDAGNACDRCGKELVVARHEPVKLLESKPETLAVGVAKAAVATGGGCMAVLGVILMVLGVLFLIGFLLLLNLMSQCKA